MTLEEEIRSRCNVEELDKEDPDYLYLELLEKIRRYHPSEDVELIERAYRLAADAHQNAKRKSGEPYIIHPLHVAIILAELELDKESIAAGLLHDVIEDTKYSYDDLVAIFGKEITELVDGVTKLTNLPYAMPGKEDVQAENLRKMFLAMAKDIRVILIKLADRLHNMRTLQHMRPEKQIEKSRETMDIYSPLAQRLGISKVKVELDDWALRYLEPDMYATLEKELEIIAPERDHFIEQIVEEVRQKVCVQGRIEAEIYGRVKHKFSLYKKMKNQNKRLDQIYDIFAIRLIVKSVKDCYGALGYVHEMYTPVPGRFKDYIAMPKPNGYRSLHTTVISKSGKKFEVQIRTQDMHRVAEYGIAAHWKYKEGKAGEKIGQAEVDKMTWLREILELQKDNEDNSEFVSEIKSELNLFADSVFCFTPQGKVLNLPAGSTVIDFAYRIHTAVGNTMVGAIVNDRVQPIDYVIQNGDRIQIQTSQNSNGPSMDWLKICQTPAARTKIRQWFKQQNRPENIEKGEQELIAYCKSKGYNYAELDTPEAREKILHKYRFSDWESALATVGHGGLKEGQIINKMREVFMANQPVMTDEEVMEKMKADADRHARAQKIREKEQVKKGKRTGQFIIYNSDGTSLTDVDTVCTCAHCCNPLPGDDIVGFITRNRGIKVHRTDCKNYLSFAESEDGGRSIEVEWASDKNADPKTAYDVGLTLYTEDRPGMLVKISMAFAESNFNISSINSSISSKNIATINIRISVKSAEDVNSIINKLRQIDGVEEVKRS